MTYRDEDNDPTETITLDLALTLRALRRDGSLERRFSVGEELGRGGMGTVRVGIDRHLGRTIALKVMHESLADSAPLVSRFLLEAQLAAQLEHPNILPIYTLERDAFDRPGLAMKLIQGQTYHDYLWLCAREAHKGPVDTGPYALHARIEPLIKICEALAYAHKRGVIHRDVKPANVMLAENGQVYLMDWGLARVQNDPRAEIAVEIPVHGPSDGHQTRPGQVIGTPAYMAPEQARAENHILTGAADQFSMGLTLYEAMTLRVARSAGDDAVARRQARDGLVPQVSHRFGHPIPPRLVAVVKKATMPQVDHRYPSMGHFAEDLRRVFTDAPLLAVEEPRMRRLGRAVTDRPTRTLGVLIGLALAAVLGGVAAAGSAVGIDRRTVETTAHMAAVQAAARAGSHALDQPLAKVARVLEATASTVSTLYGDEPPSGVRRPLVSALYPPDGYSFEWSDDHHHRITWDRPSYYVVPDVLNPGVGNLMLRMARLDVILPTELAWAIDEPRAGPIATKRLSAREGAIFRVYVTFADGLMVHYPGYGEVTQGYDPRLRPAYLAAAHTHGRRFRPPYANLDTPRVLLPCNVAMYARDGTFIGVAGVDVSIARLVRALPVPAAESWLRAMVVDEHGLILAAATRESPGFVATPSTHLPAVEKLVGDELSRRESNGLINAPDRVIAYDRAEAVGWYYVLEVPLP